MDFYDDDLIGDEFLGSFSFDIGAELRKLPLDCRDAAWHQAFPLEKARPLPAQCPLSSAPSEPHRRAVHCCNPEPASAHDQMSRRHTRFRVLLNGVFGRLGGVHALWRSTALRNSTL